MIEADHLSKQFGDRRVVDDLSFTARAGQVTGFLGPNGAGKTTTFRILLGLAAPTAGRALIDGRPYGALAEPRRTVGAVLESSGFHPGRTGRNHLAVIATAAGLPRRRIDDLLDLVGLPAAADRRVGGYSLGMRQRLALAAALLGDPPVIVLDEPTNGLDPEGVAWLRTLTRQWAAEGRCVLVASHLLAEVAQAVDRVVIITTGRVVHESDVDDLTSAQLRVRTEEPGRLAAVLATLPGITVDPGEDGTLHVRGATPEQVGRAAADAEIPVYELAAIPAGQTLEDLFLALTGTSGSATTATGRAAGAPVQTGARP